MAAQAVAELARAVEVGVIIVPNGPKAVWERVMYGLMAVALLGVWFWPLIRDVWGWCHN